jgi:Methyltransferase FkbM domain
MEYHGSFRRLYRSVTRRLIRDETKYRRVLWEPARGCYLPIGIQTQLRTWIGIPEIEIARYFRGLVEKGSCCFDIGAALGYYTVALVRFSGNGRVFAFEPDERLYRQLHATVERNNFHSGTIGLYSLMVGKQVTPSMTTIDSFVGTHGNVDPDFIKIDVEGGEYYVLLAGEAVITRKRPRFIIEVHSAELERSCISFLALHDYVWKIVDQQTFWPEDRAIEHNRWVVAVARTDPKISRFEFDSGEADVSIRVSR